ncbi:DoxX family protein [Paenibacillus ginsengarvi]|uniref:DoxX family protein n=1 Tax=Paenibacillus ginsengarvi TaxID=400777 RepID=A0A3B0B211_9BACL|nr:DoxX family protein [Paenibacillus ginsengarvi]RKN66048.1 DoxX family protein [Paenibacillus ginsengarvi]
MNTPISRGRLWTGRILSGIAVLFMLFDSISKLLKVSQSVEGSIALGYAEHHVLIIGILGLVSTIVYAFPRTAPLGAILLTGYFGGAIATQIRMDAPLFSNVLFSVYLAIFVWGGIWLRDDRVRRLFSL